MFTEFFDNLVNEKEVKEKKPFSGAFTYHLHYGNCGSCVGHLKSYFHHYEIYFKELVQEKLVKL